MELCWNARSRDATTATTTTTPTLDATQRRAQKPGLTAVTLENVQEQLLYLDRYRVLVCKEHCTGIQNVDVHLRSQHAAVTSAERKAVVDYCRRWPVTAPQDIQLPPPLGPPIQELGEPLDALRCRHDSRCSANFVTVSKDMLRKHCNKEHRQAWKGDTSTLYKRVKAQTFFQGGGLQRYFVVNAANVDRAPSVPREAADVVKERIAEWQLT
jgi:hypothetical protein